MPGMLEGKTALITGAGSGIGRATSLAFHREGAKVVVSDIDEDFGRETQDLIKQAGGTSVFVRCDVTDAKQVDELVATTVAEFGRLDCAFNNAGVEGALATTADYPVDEWELVIKVNLTGVWMCMRAELPQMVSQGGGSIVNAASGLGLQGYAYLSGYNASKHGVIGLTKTAALEYAAKDVRVNAVCPGWIETPMVMERGTYPGKDPDIYQKIADQHAAKRLGKPEEVAQAVTWLSSDLSSFVTGHALTVDGGYTAGRIGVHVPNGER
jgi:NAD(P)-dependent dehydrogenase (short-subunit alcohol dehydrogenase family)